MKNQILLGLTALSLPVSAGTVTLGLLNGNSGTNNDTFEASLATIQGNDAAGNPRSATLLLPKFDTMMGQRVLTGIRIDASGDLSGNITAENTETDGPIEATGRAAGSLEITIDRNGDNTFNPAVDQRQAVIALQNEFSNTRELAPSGFGEPAGTPQPNQMGDDFFDFGTLITGGGSNSLTLPTDATTLARFTATQADSDFAIFLTGTSAFSVTFDGGTGQSRTRQLTGFATPTVTYTFDDVVPEPSSTLLLGLVGLTSLTLRRRSA